jgi:magnesium chelatase family protein
VVTISRAKAALTFPARFMLVTGMNPCPCGYFGDNQKACSCGPSMIQRYKERISGPLLDRIDLRITVPRLPAEDLIRAPLDEATAVVRERVLAARRRAIARQGVANAQLAGQALRQHARLNAASEGFMKLVVKQLALSGRGFDRLLRVARTIADLIGEEEISEAHLAEAVSYREAM